MFYVVRQRLARKWERLNKEHKVRVNIKERKS